VRFQIESGQIFTTTNPIKIRDCHGMNIDLTSFSAAQQQTFFDL
jgi:hypothetical protein